MTDDSVPSTGPTVNLEELLALGELGGVEFKGPRPYRPPKPLKIVRAILGMSNRRDGGFVVVGVSEDDGEVEVIGLTEEELEGWKADSLIDLISQYGAPRPQLRLTKVEYEEKTVVVIRVFEFDSVPIICRKDGHLGDEHVLRRGAVYVRPIGKAETVPVESEEDMRDLIERATTRRLTELIQNVGRAGGQIVPTEHLPGIETQPVFDQELGDF